MNKWKEYGKISLLWTGVVVLLSVGGSLTAFLLEGRSFWKSSTVVVTSAASDIHSALAPIPDTVRTINTQISSVAPLLVSANQFLKTSTKTVSDLSLTESKLNAGIDLTFHNINVDCPTPKQLTPQWQHCGTLSDIDSTLGASRAVMERVGLGVDRFDKHEDSLFAQESDFYVTAKHSAASFDAIVSNPSINASLDSGSHILATADKLETKLSQCTLNPTFKCVFKTDSLFTAQLGGYILSGLH